MSSLRWVAGGGAGRSIPTDASASLSSGGARRLKRRADSPCLRAVVPSRHGRQGVRRVGEASCPAGGLPAEAVEEAPEFEALESFGPPNGRLWEVEERWGIRTSTPAKGGLGRLACLALGLALLVGLPALADPPPSSPSATELALEEGGQQHFLTWGGPGQAHLLLRADSRLVVAFPSENVGVSLWFAPETRLRVVSPPRMQAVPHGQRLEVDLRSQAPTLEIRDVVLDSIRTIRDRQTLGPSGVESVRRDRQAFARRHPVPENWAQERVRVSAGRWEAERVNLDGGAFRAVLLLPAQVRVLRGQDGWTLSSAAPFDLRLVAEVPSVPLTDCTPEELFTPEALALWEDPRSRAAMQGLIFLAPQEKFMAGSWRFLTYFGRDTLLSLMLLDPALTEEAWVRGLRSVLERLSPTGQVAHEEDLGPWAERRRVAGDLSGVVLPSPGRPLSPETIRDLYRPLFDYKMVDDDFLLACALARLGERSPQALGRLFADPQAREAIMLNFGHVLASAEPYGQEPSWRRTVALFPGESVGEWRDSNEGLGGGRHPMNVNAVLVPAALRAVVAALDALPGPVRESSLERLPGARERAVRLARVWEGAGRDYTVRLDPAEIRERLARFLEEGPLTPAERAFYSSLPVEDVSLGAFLEGASALEGGLEFPALALDAEGRPVAIMNSDVSFQLFLGNPSARQVEVALRLLELPYPVGLRTGVGPVVANAACSADPGHWETLGRGAYHGAVVWSWQSAMLRAGLARLLPRFREQDPALARRMEAVLADLAASQERAGELAGSELWTFEVSSGDWRATPFGTGTATSGDESNPVQLWSTVQPALLLRERALLQGGSAPGP